MLLIQQAKAYCIYNKTNKRFLDLRQTSYHTKASLLSLFRKHVGPTSQECCPYTSPDCSESGTKDEVVEITIRSLKRYCYRISIPAGGWVNVNDPKDEQWVDLFDFQVFNADRALYGSEMMQKSSCT